MSSSETPQAIGPFSMISSILKVLFANSAAKKVLLSTFAPGILIAVEISSGKEKLFDSVISDSIS